MEQHRILWIAAAVGIFLLVVVGATLVLYSPARPDSESTRGALADNTWTRLPDAPAGQTGVSAHDAPPQQTVPISQTPPVGIQPSAVSQTDAAQGVVKSGDVTVITETTRFINNGGLTIDLTPLGPQANAGQSGGLSGAVSPVAPITPPPSPVSAVTTAPPPPPKAPPAPSVPSKTSSPAPAPKPVSVPVSAKKPLADQYWVQAASFKSKKNADNAREALMANKIPCEVFTHTDSTGTVYYRVRVGPYTTKSEAEYWQGRISQNQEFAGLPPSYVTNAAAKAQ
jgi:cell division septation protein DedD